MTPKYAHLLSPLVVRGRVLKNRMACSNSLPHFLQGPEPYPADTVIAHYENKAKSAAIVTCMGINNFTRGTQLPMFLDFGHFPDFDLYDTTCQNYLMQLADSIHFYDSLACMGLFVGPPSAYPIMRPKKAEGPGAGPDSDTGAISEIKPDVDSDAATSAEDIVDPHAGVNPFEQTKNLNAPPPVEFDIEKIPAHEDPSWYTDQQLEDIAYSYAEQAGILQMLDFDMVSVHMCYNGNLPARMFSKKLNTRTDKWGGSLENRMRFPLLVLQKIREKVGPKMIIEIQWSPEEEDGYDMAESAVFLNEAKKYIDIVQLRYYEVDHAHPISFNLEHTPFLHYGAYMKKHVPGLVIGVIGGFFYPEECDRAIAEGKADLIYAARAYISNPDYGQLILEGREDDLVPCLRCNKCHGRGEHDPFVSVCSVNPLIGIEQKVSRMQLPTAGGKRVALIGGGPAAMRCAMYLKDRGHTPVIYEKGPQLGGAIIHADYVDFKWTLKDFKDFLIRQINKRGIEVHLNTEATPEMIEAEEFDAVVVAVGADPALPPVEGAETARWNGVNIYGHVDEVGQNVVVIGGASTAAEAACYLAESGKNVIEISRQGRIAYDLNPIRSIGYMNSKAQKLGVKVKKNAKTLKIEPGQVTYLTAKGKEKTVACDDVVVTGGFTPRVQLAVSFAHSATEFYMIGDCRQPGTMRHAIRDAYAVAMQI